MNANIIASDEGDLKKNIKFRIIDELKDTGNLLEEGYDKDGKGSIALRKLQSLLSDFLEEPIDHYENYFVFLVYFLEKFIDDIFFNLTGDFPWDESYGEELDKMWADVFKTLGIAFQKIEYYLEDPLEIPKIYLELEGLIQFYFKTINKLNTTFANCSE